VNISLGRYKDKLCCPRSISSRSSSPSPSIIDTTPSSFIMKSGFAIAALAFGGMSFAQSTVIASSAVEVDGQTTTLLSNIDPSDIASLPEPEVLGPPIGVVDSVPSATYNAAEATASVLALVAAATDAQTAVIAPVSSAIAASKTPVAVETETASARKRSYVGGLSGNVQRRDTSYPIDTSKYVRTSPNLLDDGKNANR
jgi:hypothetical protein